MMLIVDFFAKLELCRGVKKPHYNEPPRKEVVCFGRIIFESLARKLFVDIYGWRRKGMW